MAGDGGHNLVLGLGNILLKDDGIGVWLVRELQKKGHPPGVETWEGGTDLLTVPGLLRGKTRLLVVDALRGGEEPGTLYRLSAEDFPGHELEGKFFSSLHDIGIPGLLRMPEMARWVCSWKIIGVEPQEIGPGYGLTDCLQAKLAEFGEIVWHEAENMSHWQDSLSMEASTERESLPGHPINRCGEVGQH